jgi:hypothetical protein
VTPGMYIALARDIGITLALAFLVWKIYSAGEDRVHASDLKSIQAQIVEQGKTLDRWRTEKSNANDQLSKDMATLHAPAVDKPPVWLCDGPTSPRSEVLPAPAPKASPQLPAAGGVVQGPGRNIRPAIEALKLKYETALAECRAEHAEWPTP